MKAVILAGGFGTRLREVVKDVPKPMALIAGKPFLEHQIRSLKKEGIEDIVLAVHYGADIIKSHFGRGARWEVNLIYSEEEKPLGTAGAIRNAKKYLDDTFFILNGDSYSKINLKDFLNFHKSKDNEATISLSRSPGNGSHYGNVVLENGKITKFSEKDDGGKGFVNSGIYLFEPSVLSLIEEGKKVSLEREVFPKLAEEGRLGGYSHSEYFIDIGRPETYFQFKRDFLDSITLKSGSTIRDAIKTIKENETSLVIVNDEKNKFKGILTERIIMEYLVKEDANLEEMIEEISVMPFEIAEEGSDEQTINEKLSKGINQLPIVNPDNEIVDIRFRNETKKEVFPVVKGKSPLRISFSGGGTDIPYFFEKHGGIVISSTIDKYCHAIAKKRADSRIVIESDMSDKEMVLDGTDLKYDGKFDIIKAVYNQIKPNFGVDFYLYNDIPPGRGLGSSASLSVLVAKLINQLQGIKYGDDQIAKIAFKAEQEELGIGGGWQDQYAAVTGGFNFMEFGKSGATIYPLRLKPDTINELNSRLLIYYVGASHFSGSQHKSQEKSFFENEEDVTAKLNLIKENARKIKDSLLMGELDEIGNLLHESWENKKRLSGVSNNRINHLYDVGMENGGYGGKLLGSGGGGYLLFFHNPKKRNQIVRALENEGGEVLNFGFESQGANVWFADV